MTGPFRRDPGERVGKASAIALGASIPVSVAFDNLLLVLLLAAWIFGGHYREKLNAVSANPVSFAAIGLFVLLALGVFWSPDINSGLSILNKYLDLLFVPILFYYFRNPDTRRLGWMAFATVMTVTLALSLMLRLGLIPQSDVLLGSMRSPVVFKFRITHNYLMAFAAMLFAVMAIQSRNDRTISFTWMILAALAAINILFMVEGVTGQIVLAALMLCCAWMVLPRRAIVITLIASPMAVALLLSMPGPVSERFDSLVTETRNWQPGVGQRDSSAGLRLEFMLNSGAIIRERPVWGVGTGGFAAAYADQVKGTTMLATTNPHNEYLMITAQIGLAGLLLFLALFTIQWRAAKKLPTAMETGLARGLVIAMAIGCLFNSFLLDHAEGLFFAWMSGLLFAGYRSDTAAKPA